LLLVGAGLGGYWVGPVFAGCFPLYVVLVIGYAFKQQYPWTVGWLFSKVGWGGGIGSYLAVFNNYAYRSGERDRSWVCVVKTVGNLEGETVFRFRGACYAIR
jgi:hypothetical protein